MWFSEGVPTVGSPDARTVHDPQKATPAEQLSALARAAPAINENLELSPLLTAICMEARTIMSADTVAAYLTDGEGGVVAEAGDGVDPGGIGYRLELGQGLAGRVAQEGRPLAADDYQELARPPS